MPGFLRACYLTVCRYLSEKEDNRKTKTNEIEVEEMKLDQTSTKNEPSQVGKDEKLNLKNYVQLKFQLIRSLEEGDEKIVRNLEMREMIIQEIDLLTQLVDKK